MEQETKTHLRRANYFTDGDAETPLLNIQEYPTCYFFVKPLPKQPCDYFSVELCFRNMLKLKLHLANLLCVFTVLLISSNIVVNAMDVDVIVQTVDDSHDQKKQGQIITEDTDQVDNGMFNLIKDPTEGDGLFDYIIPAFPSVVFVIIQGFEEQNKAFFYYRPLLNSIPLWIQNRQIRI